MHNSISNYHHNKIEAANNHIKIVFHLDTVVCTGHFVLLQLYLSGEVYQSVAEPLHSSPIEPPGLNRFHLCDITGINPHIP